MCIYQSRYGDVIILGTDNVRDEVVGGKYLPTISEWIPTFDLYSNYCPEQMITFSCESLKHWT